MPHSEGGPHPTRSFTFCTSLKSLVWLRRWCCSLQSYHGEGPRLLSHSVVWQHNRPWERTVRQSGNQHLRSQAVTFPLPPPYTPPVWDARCRRWLANRPALTAPSSNPSPLRKKIPAFQAWIILFWNSICPEAVRNLTSNLKWISSTSTKQKSAELNWADASVPFRKK